MLQTKTTCPRAWAHSRRPLLGILALAGLAAAAACGSGEEATGPGGPGGGARGGPPGGLGGAPRPETAVPVEVVEILPGSIAAFIETNGTLEAEREVDIVARTGGPIVGLNTEEGRQVKAGELLAQIDELEARAQVEIARVTLQDAETAYDRAKASLENAIVSREVYDQAARSIGEHLDAGRDVACLCEGDPFFYGSFSFLFQRMVERYPVRVIPGVSSLTACAAAVGAPLATRNDVLAVVPATLDEAELRIRLEAVDAAAVIKVGRHVAKVRAVLDALELLVDAHYVERATMERERRLPLSEFRGDEAPYFSMVLVHRRGFAWN